MPLNRTNGGFMLKSTADITAVAGQVAQATAVALTAEVNFVTGADDTAAVRLPPATRGMTVIVKSITASKDLVVFPASGATINALQADAGLTMADATAAMFIASSSTQWYTLPLLPS